MSVYLEEHPPARPQFRATRRAKPTGGIVVHTFESRADLTLPDDGAEAGARYIARRTDRAGSYHSVVDSDSIVQLVKYTSEAWHVRGHNQYSLGLSFACEAAKWSTYPDGWVAGAIHFGAEEAAQMATWVEATQAIVIPARRISPAEFRAGQPGFIGHGELDPGRRSDPGADFPWASFLHEYGGRVGQPPEVAKPSREELVMALQRILLAHGAQNLGHTGPNRDGVDGDPGAGTIGDAITLIKSLATLAVKANEPTEKQQANTDAIRRISEILDALPA